MQHWWNNNDSGKTEVLKGKSVNVTRSAHRRTDIVSAGTKPGASLWEVANNGVSREKSHRILTQLKYTTATIIMS